MSAERVSIGVVFHDWESLGGLANQVEDLGYDYLACGEHLSFHGPTPNAFIRLAAAAGATEHLRLMSMVTLAPLYAPALLAKLVAELAVVSGERFEFGVGVGGENPQEFEAVGVDVEQRGNRTDTALRTVRSLLSADHDGAISISPLPSRLPTLWVAGRSKASLRRTVELGDGWIPYMISASRYQDAVSNLHEMSIESRGMPWEGRLGLFFFVSVAESREAGRAVMVDELSSAYNMDMSSAVDRYGVYGTPDQCVETISEYRDAGVDTFIARPLGRAQLPELNQELLELVLGRVRNAE